LAVGCGRVEAPSSAGAGGGEGVRGQGADKSALPSQRLSDDGEIKVAACEYTLRKKLTASTNETVFISLTDAELRVLVARLPGCRFRPLEKAAVGDHGWRDSETGDEGFQLFITEEIAGNGTQATASILADFGGAGLDFECQLVKRAAWTVEKIRGPGVMDAHWPPGGQPPK
jgi:hypothetical protein